MEEPTLPEGIRVKTLEEILEEQKNKSEFPTLGDLDDFATKFSSLSKEQIAEGLIGGLEENISKMEEYCKGEDGSIDQTKLRSWLLTSIGIRTLRTGSDINYYWLADGVFYVEKEIEKLDENSPLKKRAEEAIDKVRPIFASFATDWGILNAATRADHWNEGSRFVFLRH